MVKLIQNLIGNDSLATIIMSFVPLIELKGGIVFARGAGLDLICAFLFAYAGSTLAFFPIYFLLKPLLNCFKKLKWFQKFVQKIECYFSVKAQIALEKQKQGKKDRSITFLKQLGVFIFVAIPLPMTGVWTGTAIAVFLGLKFKQAVLPVVLGNAIAGVIISLLTQVCITFFNIMLLDYILYGLFVLAIVLLVIFLIKVLTQKAEDIKGE